jgi:hypothetical protein
MPKQELYIPDQYDLDETLFVRRFYQLELEFDKAVEFSDEL